MRKSLFNKDIKPEILAAISKAQRQINLAVAWISDSDIIAALTQKALDGIEVNIVISSASDRDILETLEKNSKTKIKIYVLGKENNNLMHHKFCVIDDSTTITGSYNYTHNAINNDENILLIDNDNELAKSFLEEFDRLLKQLNGFRKNEAEDFEPKNLSIQEQYYRDEFVNLPTEWQTLIGISIRINYEDNYGIRGNHFYDGAKSYWEGAYSEYKKVSKYQVSNIIERWERNQDYSWAGEHRAYDAITTKEFLVIDAKIKDINPLKLFPNIDTLYIENCDVEDLSFIQTMENLKFLKISNCAIAKLDFLPKNYSLEGLDLSNTLIEDFTEIKHLANLKWLSLNNTYLENIDFIQGFKKLEFLNILKTKVKDVKVICTLNRYKFERIHCDLTWPEIEPQLSAELNFDRHFNTVFIDESFNSIEQSYYNQLHKDYGGSINDTTDVWGVPF